VSGGRDAGGAPRRPPATPHLPLPPRPSLADRWALDPGIVFLNHGSFGACPRAVLAAQQALRAELEANPVAFLGRQLDDRLAAARVAIGAFVGADPDDLAFVPNATAGIATVRRALTLARATSCWPPTTSTTPR
jgi:isopenicillin-N epimerase